AGAERVLGLLDRDPELARAVEERLLLRPHGGGLHRQCVLDPLVVRDECAVGEGELVRPVVARPVAPSVALEDARHRTRAVAVVVLRGAPDTGQLPDEAVLRRLAQPRRAEAVGGAPAEVPAHGVVGVVLEMAPLLLGSQVPRPGLQHQDVEAMRGQLLGHDRASASRADPSVWASKRRKTSIFSANLSRANGERNCPPAAAGLTWRAKPLSNVATPPEDGSVGPSDVPTNRSRSSIKASVVFAAIAPGVF